MLFNMHQQWHNIKAHDTDNKAQIYTEKLNEDTECGVGRQKQYTSIYIYNKNPVSKQLYQF